MAHIPEQGFYPARRGLLSLAIRIQGCHCVRRNWARIVLCTAACLTLIDGSSPCVAQATQAPVPGREASLTNEQPRPTDLVVLFPNTKQYLQDLPPFLRDTDLRIYLRTYYMDRVNPDLPENEAWAIGGWVGYRSGWLLDTLQLGATYYGSLPLYAPEDRGGTQLLKDQHSYGVLGEAYAALRYEDYALLKAYRQGFTQGYINGVDIRMTPYTFEGVTVGGKLGPVDYLGGYLSKVKVWDADSFRSMSAIAGAPESNDGVALFGVKVAPLAGLELEFSEQYGINTFNTVFARADYTYPLAQDRNLILGAQFTDQRAVGDKLLVTASSRDWSTYSANAKAGVDFGDLTLIVAGSVTGSANTIQSPWGASPGPLSLIQLTFQRANEKAVLVGAAYDFSTLITPGLGGYVNVARGWDAIDPKSRARTGDQTEYDFTMDYRPPAGNYVFPTTRNLWFRLRGVIIDKQDGERLGWQIRFIANWELPLL
jgi:hypothetical protein